MESANDTVPGENKDGELPGLGDRQCLKVGMLPAETQGSTKEPWQGCLASRSGMACEQWLWAIDWGGEGGVGTCVPTKLRAALGCATAKRVLAALFSPGHVLWRVRQCPALQDLCEHRIAAFSSWSSPAGAAVLGLPRAAEATSMQPSCCPELQLQEQKPSLAVLTGSVQLLAGWTWRPSD